ncbi:MAG: hypothetical protein EBY57_05340 [Actinobacteria bacterium]|nr:hypothetical protein [Actinomycetota bacterium]
MKQYSITAQVEQGEVVARFTLNHSVGIKKPLVFKNIEDAKGAPLVQQLFYLPFVKEVILQENCIEVTRFDILEWEDVLEEVREQLENYLNEGGVLCRRCRSGTSISPAALDIMRDILGGRLRQALALEESAATSEVTALATRALEHHIERRLRTVSVFERH